MVKRLCLLLVSCLLLSLVSSELSCFQPFSSNDAYAMIPEYDLELREWQKGAEIQLSHALFQLKQVKAEDGAKIVFTGQSSGEPGIIYVQFSTLDGQPVMVKPDEIQIARVDQHKRTFQTSAVIPAALRGKVGVVQVTFQGKERASFLLKVAF